MPPSPFSITLRPHAPSPSTKIPEKTDKAKDIAAQMQSVAVLKKNPSFPAKGMAHYKRIIPMVSASSSTTRCTRTSTIPNIDMDVIDPAYALELAVQYDDISIARQALQRGADPEKIKVGHADDEMRVLVTYARRLNKLYPPNAASENETDLDRVLRNGLDDNSRKEAENLLRKARLGKGIPQMWRDAVKKKQLDIQRAILLLEADKNPRFRLLQKDPVTDEGIARVMKEIPYFSPKRGSLENLNCQVPFADKSEKIIMCRHLVEHRQTVQEQATRIKFDHAQFANMEAIEANVSYETEKRYDHLLAHATETHLFRNRDFGNTLVQQFAAMEARAESTRLIALTSTNHVMSLGLKIKKKDGKPHYVVELFDPEVTTSHVRVASDNPCTFETLTLKNFIAERKTYENCFPGREELSTMFVRPKATEQVLANPVQGAAENRVLTSSIEDKEINATALWHMFSSGFSGDLRRLRDEIASRPEEERIQLLAAKNADGDPGLYMALQNGHADAIKAFGELLDLIPQDVQQEILVELLAAKESMAFPGFTWLCKAAMPTPSRHLENC